MGISKDALSGFSLGAVFSAVVIEGGMHVLVHYFEPIANFMTHVAAFVVPGLDIAWSLLFPVIDAIGIGDLFMSAAGEADFLNALDNDLSLG